MAQEISDLSHEIHHDPATPSSAAAGGSPPDPARSSLPRSGSASRLNAKALEFVPRASASPPPVIHVFHPPAPGPPFFPAPPVRGGFEYYGVGGGAGFVEQEAEAAPSQPAREGLSDEIIQKITKQVEYYFSDINLATTEHLMRFISKDPDGFVPIPVIAGFKKIKALIHNNSQLAMALRTSSKLVVSDDGKKVRRQQAFTESDLEELQCRIVVAENLPEDHCYQNLMRIFSAVASVKTIRTCYPQTPNGTAPVTNRPAKLDMLFANKLHAFVEYETVEEAEKAVSELNDEKNWRSGLRVRLLHTCLTKQGAGRARKGHEGDGNGEEDVSTSNQPNLKQLDDAYQQSESLHDHMGEEYSNEKDGGVRRGRGRGRVGRGRGRGQHPSNNRNGGGHLVGTPPSSSTIHLEQSLGPSKQPLGPRMPDGTKGFTMGRGKPLTPTMATLSTGMA